MASATTDRRQGLTGDKGFKAPVQAATTANIVLSGEQTIDGVAVHANGINGYPDRVLVWNQTNQVQNGIWDVSTGSWTRSQDANGTQDLVSGTMGLVTGGTTHANQQWILTTTGIIAPGSTALVFQVGIPSLPVLAAPSGSSLVGTPNLPAPAYLKTISDIMNGEEVLIDRFLPTAQIAAIRARTSTYDCGPDVASATMAFTNGGGIYAKQGRYRFDSGFAILTNTSLRGDGDATEFYVPGDTELIHSYLPTASDVTSGVVLRDFYINKTVTGATSKYDIHLSNAIRCAIQNVHVASGHNDASYSNTNTGGIWFDKPVGSSAAAYMNRVTDCWVQNNSVWFGPGVTDSTVRGGYVWGHTRAFAIRIDDGSNAVENVVGIISSLYNGGIFLGTTNAINCRINENFFDGNPALTDGTAIYAPQQTQLISVTGNTFWSQSKFGIDTTDPIGWSATGNTFLNCNRGDAYYDDVRITGVTFGPARNIFAGNTHVMTAARTNKGYPYREYNGGGIPTLNVFSNYGVLGSGYASGVLAKPAASLSGLNCEEDGAFTPVWTSTGTQPVLGNGTLTGTYIKRGREIIASINLAIGSTSTFGTGSYYFTLPSNVGSIGCAGNVIAYHLATGVHYGGIVDVQASQAHAWPTNNADSGGSAFWSANYPVTWAAGDTINITAAYLTN